MSRRTTVTVGVLLGLVVACGVLTACGQDRGRPEETMEAFLSALGRQDTTKACEYWVVPGTSRPIGSSDEALNGCLERFQQVQDDYSAAQLEELREAQVVSAEVEGERALIGPDDIRGLDAEEIIPRFELMLVEGTWFLHRMETPSAQLP